MRTGDRLRTMTREGSVCSEVYYTLRHEGEAPALAFELEDASVVVTSPEHIVYVGESYEGRSPTPAKNVRAGDVLVSRTGPKRVVAVEATASRLVNVLTFEPALETENGLLLSAHSYHEALYSYAFLPFRIAYSIAGPTYADIKVAGRVVGMLDSFVQNNSVLVANAFEVASTSMLL